MPAHHLNDINNKRQLPLPFSLSLPLEACRAGAGAEANRCATESVMVHDTLKTTPTHLTAALAAKRNEKN